MNKIILISGCSQGLGYYLAHEFASRGYRVYAGIRNKDDIKKLRKEKIDNIFYIKLDITNSKDCFDAIQVIIRKEKRLDVLINNAGNTLSGPVTDYTDKDFINLLNVNTIGAFRLITAAIPAMKKKGGKIINITSLNGMLALPGFSLYSASKFALQALGNSLYYELAGEKIHVVNFAPGAIKHPENKERKMRHTGAREKFLLLKVLMPFVTYEAIFSKIEEIIESDSHPRDVTLGNDAKITLLLQRFLPSSIWDSLMKYVWNK